ncbi:MAG: CDP-diacylglycerol--serine O-phosphatidyltransferase [Myxococcota bacterium]
MSTANTDGLPEAGPQKTGKRRRRRPRGPRLTLNLRKAMFVLPNLFTVSSIFCGFYAIVSLSADVTPRRLHESALAIFFGLFFDMADGRVARMTRTQSAFGVQLDSLADVIVFGAAPGVVLYKWTLGDLGLLGIFTGFVYASCGALRLARFNVLAARGSGSSKFFVGLPIPLAAGVMMSLCMVHQRPDPLFVLPPTIVMAVTFLVAYLMISNVRYRTFKDIKLSAASAGVFLALLAAFAVIAWLLHPTFALLAFVSGYVAYGLVEEVVFFKRRRRERADAKAVAASPQAPPKVGNES